jgi:hypothetical protein
LTRVAEKVISSGASLIVTVKFRTAVRISSGVSILPASKLVVAAALKVTVPVPVGVLKLRILSSKHLG